MCFRPRLLVTYLMYREKPLAGKIARYNQTGLMTKTLNEAELEPILYQKPNYVTENNNGEFDVSDFYYTTGAVDVTDREGKYRFSYTGTQ